jgi:hypothetical protein
MRANKIGYWTTTTIVAFAFLAGGIFDLMRGPQLVATMTHLGYPAFLASLLGVWKLLGVGAILAPGLPRLKEWAYAGMLFDLTGAAVSHTAAGDPAPAIITPLVILAFVMASWALRPASRKLETPARTLVARSGVGAGIAAEKVAA